MTRPRLFAFGTTAARLLLGVVLVTAAFPKLGDPASFAQSIANYRMVPTEWIGWVALAVPALELSAGMLLMAGVWARGASLAALIMLLAFTIGVGQAMARGIDIDCGCFGGGGTKADGWAILRNVGLIALAGLGLVVSRPKRALVDSG